MPRLLKLQTQRVDAILRLQWKSSAEGWVRRHWQNSAMRQGRRPGLRSRRHRRQDTPKQIRRKQSRGQDNHRIDPRRSTLYLPRASGSIGLVLSEMGRHAHRWPAQVGVSGFPTSGALWTFVVERKLCV